MVINSPLSSDMAEASWRPAPGWRNASPATPSRLRLGFSAGLPILLYRQMHPPIRLAAR